MALFETDTYINISKITKEDRFLMSKRGVKYNIQCSCQFKKEHNCIADYIKEGEFCIRVYTGIRYETWRYECYKWAIELAKQDFILIIDKHILELNNQEDILRAVQKQKLLNKTQDSNISKLSLDPAERLLRNKLTNSFNTYKMRFLGYKQLKDYTRAIAAYTKLVELTSKINPVPESWVKLIQDNVDIYELAKA